MIKLKIKVTKEILERSKNCSSTKEGIPAYNCAIALAMRELFPFIWVSTDYIAVYRNMEEISSVNGTDTIEDISPIGTMELPEEAVDFIELFDQSTPEKRVMIDELEFEVEVPDSILETVNIDEVREVLKNSSTLELKEV